MKRIKGLTRKRQEEFERLKKKLKRAKRVGKRPGKGHINPPGNAHDRRVARRQHDRSNTR